MSYAASTRAKLPSARVCELAGSPEVERQKADVAIRKIHWWQPQRILLSHGRCFDADADKVVRRIFGEPPR
jgi:hypothetical protein